MLAVFEFMPDLKLTKYETIMTTQGCFTKDSNERFPRGRNSEVIHHSKDKYYDKTRLFLVHLKKHLYKCKGNGVTY